MPPLYTHPIHTRRLDLVPATLDILIADLQKDRHTLARLLDAVVPPSWPPPLLDDAALAEFVRMMSEGSDSHFASRYWCRTTRQRRRVGCSPAAGGSLRLPGRRQGTPC